MVGLFALFSFSQLLPVRDNVWQSENGNVDETLDRQFCLVHSPPAQLHLSPAYIYLCALHAQ